MRPDGHVDKSIQKHTVEVGVTMVTKREAKELNADVWDTFVYHNLALLWFCPHPDLKRYSRIFSSRVLLSATSQA